MQKEVDNRERNSKCKVSCDLRASGRKKFESASLATFNKKIQSMKMGQDSGAEAEGDESVGPNFSFGVDAGDENFEAEETN